MGTRELLAEHDRIVGAANVARRPGVEMEPGDMEELFEALDGLGDELAEPYLDRLRVLLVEAADARAAEIRAELQGLGVQPRNYLS